MKGLPTACRALGFVLLAGAALAADQEILGRKLLVSEKGSGERVIVVQGKDLPGSIGLTGDLLNLGASLTVVANGASPSTQVFTLAAAGWYLKTSGVFAYTPPTSTDPVRRMRMRLYGDAPFIVVVLRGSMGIQVAPPNPGDDGGIVLEIGGGDRYCVSFGGAAGGTESRDDATTWKIRRATARPGCSPLTTTTSTSSTSTTSVPPFTCGTSGPVCDGTCPAGYHCESMSGSCYCFTGGTGNCTTCDTPCPPGDVCAAGVNVTPPLYLVTCGCVTPPLCGAGVACDGNCPSGFFCQDTSPGPAITCACITF